MLRVKTINLWCLGFSRRGLSWYNGHSFRHPPLNHLIFRRLRVIFLAAQNEGIIRMGRPVVTVNFKRRIALFLGVLLLLAASLVPTVNCSAVDLLADEQLFVEIDTQMATDQVRQALQGLARLQNQYGARVEILWRMAQGHYELARKLKGEQRQEHLQQAEASARAAIERDPENDEGYKWLAVALGAGVKNADTRSQITRSRLVKENIEKALALDPEDDISWLILSRWHYKISRLGFLARTLAKIIYGGLPKASMEAAERSLLRAIALHDRIAHRYNLAKVYAQQGKHAQAIAQLEKALTLPVSFPEEAEDLEKAHRRLKEWQKR